MVFIRLDSSRKEVGYTLLHTVTNLKCVLTEEINFTEIYLPKSKSFIAVTLYRPQDKIDFVNCIDQISYSSKQVITSPTATPTDHLSLTRKNIGRISLFPIRVLWLNKKKIIILFPYWKNRNVFIKKQING